MKFQFLPHYFKYVGLGLFVLCTLPFFAHDFYLGFTAQSIEDSTVKFLVSDQLSSLGHFGLLIYLLAKDRVFDEYMLKLRMESAFIVVFVTLFLLTAIHLLKGGWMVNAAYFFEVQVFSYLIIHSIRKRL